MLIGIILVAVSYYGFIAAANKLRATKIDPGGCDNFTVILFWHALWGFGWGLGFLGASIIISVSGIPIVQSLWWIPFIPSLILMFFGLLPLLFGPFIAGIIGFLGNEIGHIKIINDYFRFVHGIHWEKN